MQVSAKKDEPEFQPVTLTVVLQTRKELDMMLELAGYDETIPAKVAELSQLTYDDQLLLQTLLQTIHTVLIRDAYN